MYGFLFKESWLRHASPSYTWEFFWTTHGALKLSQSISRKWRKKLERRWVLISDWASPVTQCEIVVYIVLFWLSYGQLCVDKFEVPSDKFCIPEAFWSATRRISHQWFHLSLEAQDAYAGTYLVSIMLYSTVFSVCLHTSSLLKAF